MSAKQFCVGYNMQWRAKAKILRIIVWSIWDL